MSAEPPAASEPDSDDPIGTRYPNTARIWNYQLGGKDNFAVDRAASEAANAMVRGLGVPAGAVTAVESRHLLQRMVDYLAGQGVRQFLDLGSGLPNMANTHQIAHRAAPEARIVYVDIDPLVSSHAAGRMAGRNVVTLRADLREPEQVLSDSQVRDLFDFGQPVAIMFMCVLHCLWDREDPWGVVGHFRDAVAPGSYLALSHMTREAHPEAAEGLFRMTRNCTGTRRSSRVTVPASPGSSTGSRWSSPAWWPPPSGGPTWTIRSATATIPMATASPCSS
jgi:SAM-dependent methyltransferase